MTICTTLRSAILVSGCLSLALAAEPALTREGKYWVEVRSGSEPMAPSTRLRITSRGAVTFNGMPRPELSYELKIRVKASSVAEARLLANRFGVHIAKQGGNAMYLVVQRGDGMADLQVKAPRTASETTIATTEGAVAFYDLDGGVQAETGGGAVAADRIKGNIVVRTAGGDITLGSVGGNGNCTTAGGRLTAGLLAGKPMSDSFLSTGGGDITVIIPSNLGVTIRAQNELAGNIRRIVSDFPGISVRVEGGQVVAEGPVNGGGPILRISGTGGTIFIKRQH